jgi:two-component system cell cycle sensor histidine kinase/response regulator CckA
LAFERAAAVVKSPLSDEDARQLVHDFSNLLTALIGAADAVLERSELDPETRDDVRHIREGVRRGSGMIRRLRGDAPEQPGLISVNDTIRATSRLLAHRLGTNIALTLALGEPDAWVRAEPSQLDRLLLNLIANASYAMPGGGTVTLGSARRVIGAAQPRMPDTIPPGDFGVITVADTGTGIARDQLSRIFEPGISSRGHEGGSGLGLSSVRDIVRQSGGFLAVESVEGRGTRFEIFLPHRHDRTPAGPKPRSVVATGTVLLVEDDLLVRQIAERVLHRAGWTVLCADSAEHALEVLKDSFCDLMISDVAMPGMDGVTLARHVQTLRPGLPIILTSGYERSATEDGYDTKDVTFLAKPYGQDDLLAAVTLVAAERTVGALPRT